MPPSVADVVQALQSCVGKRLDGIETAVFRHPRREGSTIIQIALDFESAGVCLGTAGNGGLQMSALSPVADMAEFGRIERDPLSSAAAGTALRRVSRLLSLEPGPEYDEPVGVALLFDGDELWIFNRADDVNVVDGPPGRPGNLVRIE